MSIKLNFIFVLFFNINSFENVPKPIVLIVFWSNLPLTYLFIIEVLPTPLFPNVITLPQGETFYSVMDRLRLFFVKFWESDETECTIVSHGAITNILSLMFLQAPLEKFWSMYMSACGVSKIQMKSIYSFTIEYRNDNHFFAEGEKKYFVTKIIIYQFLDIVIKRIKKGKILYNLIKIVYLVPSIK